MKHYPCILSVAGSDCSGGAGIQADLKTISALGAYAATAITAVTVQNTCGVTAVHVLPPAVIEGQIEAVMTDLSPHAVKIGMVTDCETVRAIVRCLCLHRPPFVVFDPVMVSTSGQQLMDSAALEAVTNELMPCCTLITPNLPEAELLLGRSVSTPEEMCTAARHLLRYGSQAVLLKGGHLDGHLMTDVLQLGQLPEPYLFTAPRVESGNTHGTGCTLSSAIATYLALGHPLHQAVGMAKDYVRQALVSGKEVQTGAGNGPLNHLFNPCPMHIFSEEKR